MDNLTADTVVKDLVNYSFVKKSLEKYPKWKDDPSVPKKGDPYTRTEVIEL